MKNYLPKILLILLLAVTAASCKKTGLDKDLLLYETFTIPKGSHDSGRNPKIHRGSSLRFTVKFDSTAIYTSMLPRNQHAINKLFGISDCGSHHHTNSVRIGWRWLNERLELHAYYYNGSERKDELIDVIEIDSPVKCSIDLSEDAYIVTVGNKTYRGIRSCKKRNFIKYYLFPYFGGEEAAPHDIRIKIAEEKG
jgi:hypothetical protein